MAKKYVTVTSGYIPPSALEADKNWENDSTTTMDFGENPKGISISNSIPPPTLNIPAGLQNNEGYNIEEVTATGSANKVKWKPDTTIEKTPYVATEYQRLDGNYYNDDVSDDDDFSISNWGYDDFILERNNFQKSVTSLFNEPAFFYFKLFFKFKTGYGLLAPDGGKLIEESKDPTEDFLKPRNSALSYLWNLSRGGMEKYYGNSSILDRYKALRSFINILSYINTTCPWFFKSVKGLDKVENFMDFKTDDNVIEIGCMQEAIDMKLETLLGLYKYACYDTYNQREIIPENLRMFDMAIMVFQTPLRYYHTGMISRSTNTNFKYKNIHGEINTFNYGNKMSYKIIFFKNCEILEDTYKSIIPGELNNERPTSFDNINIRIKYQKALSYNFNEFLQLKYGDFIDTVGWGNFEQYPLDKKRFEAIKKNLNNLYYYNPYSTKFKDLIDASESVMRYGMRMVLPEFCMGNLYGTRFSINSDYYKKKIEKLKKGSIKSGNIYGDATNTKSEYFKEKIKRLKSRNVYGNLYGDTTNISGDYFKDKINELKEKSIEGNFYNNGTSIKSKYFKAKLEELKKKSLQGNIYGNLTSINSEYFNRKLEILKKGNPTPEDKLKLQTEYNNDGRTDDKGLEIKHNDYKYLLVDDNWSINDIIKYKDKKSKGSYVRNSENNLLKINDQHFQENLKSKIKRNDLSIDEEKQTLMQEIKNVFLSDINSVVDEFKSFDLKKLFKW